MAPAGRHGVHARRALPARLRQDLSPDSAFGRGDRDRQRRLSSRGLAGRARRVRRTARIRAEPVSGRRQFRPVDRTAAGGLRRGAVRAAFGARLHHPGADRRRSADPRQPVVRGASRGAQARSGVDGANASARRRRPHDRRAYRHAVLEGGLSGEHWQLLHLLSDRDIPRLDPAGPGDAVRFSGCGRGRHHTRRAADRPVRGANT